VNIDVTYPPTGSQAQESTRYIHLNDTGIDLEMVIADLLLRPWAVIVERKRGRQIEDYTNSIRVVCRSGLSDSRIDALLVNYAQGLPAKFSVRSSRRRPALV